LFDILVAFRTSILNKEGEEILDSKKIAKAYILGGRFWIDFFSVFPLDKMAVILFLTFQEWNFI